MIFLKILCVGSLIMCIIFLFVLTVFYVNEMKRFMRMDKLLKEARERSEFNEWLNATLSPTLEKMVNELVEKKEE